MSPRKSRSLSDETSTQAGEVHEGFTAEEQAAMKERLQEQKMAARASKGDLESTVLAKIEAMSEPDRSMALRIHHLVRVNAPSLTPRLWYGMPAYANGGKVICFFQGAQKFKTRYATLGFTDAARLDEGHMWPVAFALKTLTPAEETTISALLKKAVGDGAPQP